MKAYLSHLLSQLQPLNPGSSLTFITESGDHSGFDVKSDGVNVKIILEPSEADEKVARLEEEIQEWENDVESALKQLDEIDDSLLPEESKAFLKSAIILLGGAK